MRSFTAPATRRDQGGMVISQFCLAHSLLAGIVEKAEIVKRGSREGRSHFKNTVRCITHLFGAIILAEHLYHGSRDNRGISHLEDMPVRKLLLCQRIVISYINVALDR